MHVFVDVGVVLGVLCDVVSCQAHVKGVEVVAAVHTHTHTDMGPHRAEQRGGSSCLRHFSAGMYVYMIRGGC